jgi:glycosyltransferase involved in cell wall biosynthesis
VRSAVRDGVTGIVVTPEDPRAAATAIDELLRDTARRRAWGAAGRRSVEEYFNWDRVARDVQDFAAAAVADRRSPDAQRPTARRA